MAERKKIVERREEKRRRTKNMESEPQSAPNK